MTKLKAFFKNLFAKKETPKPDPVIPVPKPITPIADHAINPGYSEAKKHDGKTEFDSKFNKYLSGFWALVGLPSYKTIIGTSFAWCGLFIFAMQTEVGMKAIGDAAAAISWSRYGQPVDWKKNGIPKSAVVRINHNGNCKSSSGNHVTYADGDCTSEELSKPGATFPGFGGNQGNTVKRSSYSVTEICDVRWPSEMTLPGKIIKSNGCTGKASGDETTR